MSAPTVRSTYKYARISPQKARQVTRAITGMPVSQALSVLDFTPKKGAFLVGKALRSAVANAENNHGLDIDALVVAEAWVGKNLIMRRFAARGRGRSSAIEKPFSQITIVVRDASMSQGEAA